MVKITTYNLTSLSESTLELLNIMIDARDDHEHYFILYTQEMGRPFKKHTHLIGSGSEIIFKDNLMEIINPHSCSIINLEEERGYKVESKRIGE